MAERAALFTAADTGTTRAAIAHADVVRIAWAGTLKASKMLTGWREQGLLVALSGRAKRNMAHTKPSAADNPIALLFSLEDNNGKFG